MKALGHNLFRSILRYWCFSVLLFVFGSGLAADNFAIIVREAEGKLRDAIGRLDTERESIGAEKKSLADKLSVLRTEVVQLRKDLKAVQRREGQFDLNINALEKEVRARSEELAYVENLLGQYVQGFAAQINIAELQTYNPVIERALNKEGGDSLGFEVDFKPGMEAVQTAIERLEKLAGGAIQEGRAIAPGGDLVEGKFLFLGPLAYFSENDSKVNGIVEQKVNIAEAAVLPLDELSSQSIAAFFDGENGNLPIDPTLGGAMKVAATKDTFGEHVRKGGIVLYFILGLGGITILVALFKWIEISRVKRARPGDLQAILSLLREGKKDDALTYAENLSGPVKRMLVAGIEHSEEDKVLIEEVFYEHQLKTQPVLERMIPFIAVTAATAPLLGLLGTVTGMIKTFKLITVFGTGDAAGLSSGISEALITTEFGLLVAIPSLIIHALLMRHVRGVLASMEQTAAAFLNGLKVGKLKS